MQVRHEQGADTLDGISAGLVARLSGLPVGDGLLLAHRTESDLADADVLPLLRAYKRYPAQHPVGAPGEQPHHGGCLTAVAGLAQDALPDDHRRIRCEYRKGAAPLDQSMTGTGLVQGKTLYVSLRCLAREPRLIQVNVEHGEADADLLQKVAPSGGF